MEKNMIDTAKTLKKCMKARKLSQKELMKVSGYHHRTVANILKGNGCRFDTFETLMNAMGYELKIVDVKKDEKEKEA